VTTAKHSLGIRGIIKISISINSKTDTIKLSGKIVGISVGTKTITLKKKRYDMTKELWPLKGSIHVKRDFRFTTPFTKKTYKYKIWVDVVGCVRVPLEGWKCEHKILKIK